MVFGELFFRIEEVIVRGPGLHIKVLLAIVVCRMSSRTLLKHYNVFSNFSPANVLSGVCIDGESVRVVTCRL